MLADIVIFTLLPDLSLTFGTAGWVRNGRSRVLIGVRLPSSLRGLTDSPSFSLRLSSTESLLMVPLLLRSSKRSKESLRSFGLHLGIFPSQLPSALHMSFGLPTRTYLGDVQ